MKITKSNPKIKNEKDLAKLKIRSFYKSFYQDRVTFL